MLAKSETHDIAVWVVLLPVIICFNIVLKITVVDCDIVGV